jgi:hypothetical protein
MSSDAQSPAVTGIAQLRKFLVDFLAENTIAAAENINASDVDDAIGVFAVNGVKVRMENKRAFYYQVRRSRNLV